MAQGIKLTYLEQVHAIAEAIESPAGSLARTVAVASAAFALSLAHSMSVFEVEADIVSAINAL